MWNVLIGQIGQIHTEIVWRGCNVCHDNKYNNRVKHACYTCNGLGKVRNTYYTKENIENRLEESNCAALQTKINGLDYPTTLEIAESLLGEKVDTLTFDKLDEFGTVKILDYLGVKELNCSYFKESSYTV